MNPINPRIRRIAARLVAHEAKRGKSSNLARQGELPALAKLRPHLVILMSNGGFHALLLRARTLAAAEAPWLSRLRINQDCAIAGFGALTGKLGPKAIAAGKAILLGQLLSLLEAFIGEILTLQLVNEIWPKLPRNETKPGKGDPSENQK
jgi:hypothetical protein